MNILNLIPAIVLASLFGGVVLLWWPLATADAPFMPAKSFTGRVRYIVDGDTLYVTRHRPAVRLWGVNTPEKGQRGYEAATAYLSHIAHRQPIRCQIMHRDKYGRTVGRCYLQDGRDIGRLMIESGHAVEMRGFSRGYYSNRKAWTR